MSLSFRKTNFRRAWSFLVWGSSMVRRCRLQKGNVFLLEDAVNDFGADTVRMFLMGSAEPWQDFDWRNELVISTKKQIERFFNTVLEIKDADGEPHDIDRWLISRLQSHIDRTTTALSNFQTRQALQEAYFGIETDLKSVPPPARRKQRRKPGVTYSLFSMDPAPCTLHPIHR